MNKNLLRDFINSAHIVYDVQRFESYFNDIYLAQIKRVFFYKEGLLVLTNNEGSYHLIKEFFYSVQKSSYYNSNANSNSNVISKLPNIINRAQEMEDVV